MRFLHSRRLGRRRGSRGTTVRGLGVVRRGNFPTRFVALGRRGTCALLSRRRPRRLGRSRHCRLGAGRGDGRVRPRPDGGTVRGDGAGADDAPSYRAARVQGRSESTEKTTPTGVRSGSARLVPIVRREERGGSRQSPLSCRNGLRDSGDLAVVGVCADLDVQLVVAVQERRGLAHRDRDRAAGRRQCRDDRVLVPDLGSR